MLVSGEAGVGKTRLVQEIDAEADARGLRVLTGHGVKDEGRAPYLPFTEMIEQGMVTPRSRPACARPWAGRPRRSPASSPACGWSSPRSLGNRIEQVDLGFWRSRMLRERDGPGDQEAAATLATEVAGRYRELGIRRHA